MVLKAVTRNSIVESNQDDPWDADDSSNVRVGCVVRDDRMLRHDDRARGGRAVRRNVRGDVALGDAVARIHSTVRLAEIQRDGRLGSAPDLLRRGVGGRRADRRRFAGCRDVDLWRCGIERCDGRTRSRCANVGPPTAPVDCCCPRLDPRSAIEQAPRRGERRACV